MTINEYQQSASRFISPELTKETMLINSALGIGGESGEVIDLIKKSAFHGHNLNVEKIKGEMGDVCWYLAEIATALNFNFEEVFTGNIEKLSKRYPEGFDKERSIHRKELGIE